MEEFKQRDRIFRTRMDKIELFKKAGNKCRYCGCNHIILLTADHKIPLSRGGEDELKNIDCVCGWCNQMKGDMTPTEFRRYLRALNTLAELNKVYASRTNPDIKFKPNGVMNPKILTEKEVEEFNIERKKRKKEMKKEELKEMYKLIKEEERK